VGIFEVKLSEQAVDDLKQVPVHVAFKLKTWISGVKTHGLREIKKYPAIMMNHLKVSELGNDPFD